MAATDALTSNANYGCGPAADVRGAVERPHTRWGSVAIPRDARRRNLSRSAQLARSSGVTSNGTLLGEDLTNRVGYGLVHILPYSSSTGKRSSISDFSGSA
jgi:hypothetical protein